MLLGLGVASLALGIFIRITQELLEHDVDAIDRTIILKVVALRGHFLNSAVRDITSLGSGTLVTIFCIIAVVVFASLREPLYALQVILATAAAGLWMTIAKSSIQRPRPEPMLRLISASGYSFPSGHASGAAALYLTLALIICEYIPSRRGRIAVITGAVVLILLVAFSRVYLGVHYPSDVTAGICVGAASALLVDLVFTYIQKRRENSSIADNP